MLFPGGFVGRRGTHFNSILDATDRSWDSSFSFTDSVCSVFLHAEQHYYIPVRAT